MRFIIPLPSCEKHDWQSDGYAASRPHVVRNSCCRHAGMYCVSGKPTAESSRTDTGTFVVKASWTMPKLKTAPRPPALDPASMTRVTLGKVGTLWPMSSFVLL